MAIATVNFMAKSLKKASAFNIMLPDNTDFAGPYPVLYLLHGLSDDHTIWSRRTSLERYLYEDNLPLIVVMPNTDRGWYTDAKAGYPYERHIVEDVVTFVDRHFNTIPERKGRALGGLSMGGYGSLKIGLKHPDMFCSLAVHSAAIQCWKVDDRDDEFYQEVKRIFGDAPDGGTDDVFALAEKAPSNMLPAIRMDCGVDDFLIEQNRALHKHFDTLGIEHEYEEFPGIHEWAYWDKHIRQALQFHWKTFRTLFPDVPENAET